MKIRRFVAKDMKNALAQIKDELGVDAVIMSNKKIPEGVEIMAAIDYNQTAPTASSEQTLPNNATEPQNTPVSNVDAIQSNPLDRNIDNDVVKLGQQSTITQQLTEQKVAPSDSLAALLNRQIQHDPVKTEQLEKTAEQITKQAPENIEQQFKNFTDRLLNSSTDGNIEGQVIPEAVKPSTQTEYSQTLHSNGSGVKTTTQPTVNSESVSSLEFQNMQKEMNSIRQLLEHQMSGLMWQDMAQKDPQKAVLINRLMSLGLTEQIADQISGYIPPQLSEDDAWAKAKQFITQQINTTNNDIIHRGGVVALVGPTGVGKTTTIAKLAARFAQIHGADQVALISTDSFRIAGFEQLSTYGRIIGCQVKLANDAQALDTLIQQFSQKKLILIDTAGMGQRDMRLAKHLTTLISNARVRIRSYLVLSANTQQRVMQENVERFKKIPLAGCIYTKLDESLSIGEILSTSIQNGLPIGYLTDGQRVPEDIKVANAEKLVTLAYRMAEKANHMNPTSWRPMPMNSASAV
jgi:flagellar biosynthesis protein FlhF